MRIAILGSWRERRNDYELRGTRSEFTSACREIGRGLAQGRQVVIVGGESENAADRYIVEGMLEILGDERLDTPLIEVLRPERDTESFEKTYKKNPSLFLFHSRSQPRWAAAHIMALREANTVLTIGGMDGTHNAGLAAIVARKRVIPVASFGGASALLLAALETLGDRRNLADFRILHSPWSDHVRNITLKLIGIGRLPRLLIVHGRSDDRYKLEVWLNRQSLASDVFVMAQEFGAGRSLPEKFEDLASEVDGAVIIATPDDVGGPIDEPLDNVRARQNVWLEAGWFWGKLGRDRMLILCKGQIEIPSDLHGLEYYQYRDSPEESGDKIRTFLSWLKDRV